MRGSLQSVGNRGSRARQPALALSWVARWSVLAAVLAPYVEASGTVDAAEMIGINWEGDVYRMNAVSGASKIINTLPMGHNSMAVTSSGVYVWRSSTGALSRIDPETGAATFVSSVLGLDVRAMAVDPNTEDGLLLMTDQEELWYFDLETFDWGQIGQTGISAGHQALAAGPDGTIYTWRRTMGGENPMGVIGTIDPIDGTFTQVSLRPWQADVQFMTVDASGVIHVGREDLYRVDDSTAPGVLVAKGIASDLRGADFLVPPPQCVVGLGYPCPGAQHERPRLSAVGCMEAGELLTLGLSLGYGGQPAVFVIGSGVGSIGFGDECELLVQPVDAWASTIMTNNGPGDGQVECPLFLPAMPPGTTLVVQAVCLDPTAVAGATSTQALIFKAH